MWILIGIVVVAGVVMWLAGRSRGPQTGSPVDDLSDSGLVVGDRTVPWTTVYEVRVVTRRELFKTWFGFEVSCESDGLLSVDGSRGQGERFLGHTHHLRGFDHDALLDALRQRQSGVVCYRSHG